PNWARGAADLFAARPPTEKCRATVRSRVGCCGARRDGSHRTRRDHRPRSAAIAPRNAGSAADRCHPDGRILQSASPSPSITTLRGTDTILVVPAKAGTQGPLLL